MSVHFSITQDTIRAYAEGMSYAKRDDYKFITSAVYLTDKIVYFYGAKGDLNRDDMIEIYTELDERGIVSVMMERHGKIKTINVKDYLVSLKR